MLQNLQADCRPLKKPRSYCEAKRPVPWVWDSLGTSGKSGNRKIFYFAGFPESKPGEGPEISEPRMKVW